MLNIGCTTRAFQGMRLAETARKMQEIGFTCTELCFVQSDLGGWAYNGIGDLSGITEERVCEAVQIFQSHGIDVVALGLFTDLRHPDPEKREQTLEYIRRYISFAAAAGIPYLSSECGFTPGERGLRADSYEEDYSRLKDMLRLVCRESEAAGVQMALEACVLDIIPSPRRLKTLIDELAVESDIHLTAMLDPANFIAAEDEEGMFRHLGNDIAYLHGKDRKINATYGVNLGDGDIDWHKFMALYRQHADGKPFILEYCRADNCAEIKNRAEIFYQNITDKTT